MLKFEITGFQFKDHQLRKQKFQVTAPVNMTYSFNDRTIYSTQGSAGFELEWAIGHLFRSRIIDATYSDIIHRKIDGKVMITGPDSGSAPSELVQSRIKLTAYELLSLTASFQEKSILYKDTGTAHTAAIATSKAIDISLADIYRMNVLDKIVGSIITRQSFSPIALVSGKICDLTVSTLALLGVQIIISRSGALWNACQLAESNGITLVGFARGTKFSIFGKNHHIVVN